MLSEYILLQGSNVNLLSYSSKPVKACVLLEKCTWDAIGTQYKKKLYIHIEITFAFSINIEGDIVLNTRNAHISSFKMALHVA